MEILTKQEEHIQKVTLIKSILNEVTSEIINKGLLNVTIEITVSNLKLSTLSVTTKNIKKVKGDHFSDDMKIQLLDELESCLWLVLSKEIKWFTLSIPIINGVIVRDQIQFKFTKKPTER